MRPSTSGWGESEGRGADDDEATYAGRSSISSGSMATGCDILDHFYQGDTIHDLRTLSQRTQVSIPTEIPSARDLGESQIYTVTQNVKISSPLLTSGSENYPCSPEMTMQSSIKLML